MPHLVLWCVLRIVMHHNQDMISARKWRCRVGRSVSDEPGVHGLTVRANLHTCHYPPSAVLHPLRIVAYAAPGFPVQYQIRAH